MNTQVMILEDNIPQIKSLVQHLKKNLDVEFVMCLDAETAIIALDNPKYNFSAYILDIEIENHELTGIDVAERIRRKESEKNKPIIFISAYTHFGFGALKDLHYYDFISKDTNWQMIEELLQCALAPNNTYYTHETTHLVLNTVKFQYEVNIKNISCIELIRNEVIISDLSGKETIYKVKPNAFSNICDQVNNANIQWLQQVHRCIILNFHRIQKIDWGKNTASVWLFNIKLPKPVGKTYLKKLDIFKQ